MSNFSNFNINNEAKPTYTILKRGKPVARVAGTYEDARCLVRMMIRRAVQSKRTVKKGMWDDVSRNPTGIKEYGYKIVRA